MSETRIAYRTCPLCEATCGLEVTIGPEGVRGIRGDAADVFSHGYICPKGASIGDLHHDPDRLRQPHVRRPDGTHEAVGWDEALAVPRYLRFMEQLPKTPTQRVQKFELRSDGVTPDTVDREALGIFPPKE